ncbi:glycosyltransferase family 2 protein [Vreelandella venusta]|uniref:Glycosyltransferase family 2 protein n=1 Tax=Vreelandella venusta TaxID=44935 RepID=A0ABX2BE65_9GAMM|nr:glycosyltransferase family 2 protein [Halomonas venusta]AZM94179.1 glycosyltransferase family 2 protein [Halomonas venusta]NPT32423.1 glycosyltransferase family 2 protein [Halomonas venusta]
MSMDVSVVIITRNAAATLSRTLDALTCYDDVVVYDNGSTDDTCSIVQAYSNTTLHHGEFLGFGPTKRAAVSLAKYDWIFSIDADEAPTKELNAAINDWVATATPQQAGKILRENWMLGKPVYHSGWGNDWLIRLFNRNTGNFNDAAVHESVSLAKNTEVSRLNGKIEHLAVNDLAQFLEKINRYSDLRASSKKLKHYPFALIFLKALYAFIRTYFFRLGILDGWRGLTISVANANGVFWKYAKNNANNRL